MNKAWKRVISIVGATTAGVLVYHLLKKQEPAALHPGEETAEEQQNTAANLTPREYTEQRKLRYAEEHTESNAELASNVPELEHNNLLKN